MAQHSRSSLYLPPELWIEVFRFATHCPRLYAAKYEPFQDACGEESEHDITLAVKYAIVLVCKQWRALGMEMLYEDLRIARGTSVLKDVLEEDDEMCTKNPRTVARGRWVRRAELAYTQSATPTPSPMPALDILKHCPRLEVLVRPALTWERVTQLPSFEYPADAAPLPLLKRLDWWHDNEAARTGGINSLDEVLSRTPKLEYLSLAGNMSLSLLRQQRHIQLSALKLLRLRKVNAILIRQACMLSLPSLTHVIVDASPPNQALENIWETFGSDIRCVELGAHLRFIVEDNLSIIVSSCPRLSELNYYIFFTARPRFVAPHPSLKRVGLHAHYNMALSPNETGDETWKQIEDHVDAYCPESFPSLQEFVLYGQNWGQIRQDSRFWALEEKVRAQGRRLVIDTMTSWA
ncbi:hypothetical protein EW146_g8581 [Bondarzewia mesenterica]|uniref:F-box domain-containing protein n=1 Tax=Bondarzewia mesenterica TaxID=1095465 RepID=A0A4S4LF57_9AGAM|nr:hypothetical protein EW146_g8581 [Bondarzewia mesenterica]